MAESKEKDNKQELYLEMRSLDEEVKNIHSHIEAIDQQLAELNSSKLAITKFIELKKGDELRVPLASGIYVKAELSDTSKLMINVGADITVEKKPDEVLEILESQLSELNAYKQNLIAGMKEMISRMEQIQKEFEAG